MSVGLALALVGLQPAAAWAGGPGGGHALMSGIGISILAASVLAYLGHRLKQPLLLAYIAAGAVIGPQFGLGLVDKEGIRVIAEIGLVLLLFMIGLELDLKKLKESGKSLIVTGVFQFVICVVLGLGFFLLLGFTIGPPYEYRIFGVKVLGGEYDLLYLAACLALGSTAIVVKLLHEKFELDTLAGRITLGVLVIQDIWAIILLSLQDTLTNPKILNILWAFGEGAVLVALSFLLSKYLLGFIFRRIAGSPELVLAVSLAWCFFICGVANQFELSLEMGALVAGAAISTFPYNLDVIARIISVRDFFITLFFVALGMEIPNPLHNLGMLKVAGAAALFVVATRFGSIYPILYFLKNGNRISLLVPINLSQVSEFALVITAIGIKHQHIVPDIMTLIIYVFVITSITSTYMIKYSHQVQGVLSKVVARLGFRDFHPEPDEGGPEPRMHIALLGFHRLAASFFRQLQEMAPELQQQLVVVDLNPTVHQTLRAQGVKVVYGDIGRLDTLHHAGLEEARVVISTIPDSLLVGTDNVRIIKHLHKVCPLARIVVTAETAAAALRLYQEGADYVLLPHELAATHLLVVMERLLREPGAALKDREIARLQGRQEIL